MAKNAGYIVSLNLERSRILVVGGGRIATRKIVGLPPGTGYLAVVSPKISSAITSFVPENFSHYDMYKRKFQDGDIDGYDLIFACSESESVNSRVSEAARDRRMLVNDVSDAARSSFSNVARVNKGGISVGVSSYPKVPGFSKAICRLIEETLPEDVDLLLEIAAGFRAKILANGGSLEDLDWMKAFDARVFEWIRMGDLKRAEESLAECLL